MPKFPDSALAAYRLPYSKQAFLLREEDKGTVCFSNKAFDKSTSELQFSGSKESFDPTVGHLQEHLITHPGVFKSAQKPSTREEHLLRCSKAITQLQDGEMDKVVLSRVSHFPMSAPKADELFQSLCESYPNAFVYYLIHPEHGVWCGATPEVLLNVNGEQFETMSLAGTIDTRAPRAWTEKEYQEQAFVTDYIVAKIKNLQPRELQIGPREEQLAGHLKHLKTSIQFSGPLASRAILESLHPTPAVGGTPLEEALRCIEQLESHDRRLYTGYIGICENDQNAQYFVNLRCMEWTGAGYDLFAGGGITAGSKAEDEWEETNAKLQVLQGVLEKL
jgi:isochorismate synthase